MLERVAKAEKINVEKHRTYMDEFELLHEGGFFRLRHKETGLSLQSHGVWMEEQRRKR